MHIINDEELDILLQEICERLNVAEYNDQQFYLVLNNLLERIRTLEGNITESTMCATQKFH